MSEPKKPKSVFIATPIHNEVPHMFAVSMFTTGQLLLGAGIHSAWAVCPKGTVDVARNKLVRSFLASDFDELLFIDSDLSWNPLDLMRLVARDKPVVGGAGRFRDLTGAFPIRLNEVYDDGLIEARYLPTMMLKIKREVFTALLDAGLAPIKREWAWDNKGENDVREEYRQFFAFVNEEDRIISEDYTFCNKWRSIGGQIWFEPNMSIGHHGRAVYSGNFSELK